MLIGDLFLSGHKDGLNAMLQKPSRCRWTGAPIGEIDIDKGAIELERGKIFLQIAETVQRAREHMTGIIDQLLDVKYYERIILKTKNTHLLRRMLVCQNVTLLTRLSFMGCRTRETRDRALRIATRWDETR